VLVGELLFSGAVLLLEVIDVHIHKCRAGGLLPGAVGGLLHAQFRSCFFSRSYSVTAPEPLKHFVVSLVQAAIKYSASVRCGL
jgi:hypothetical protein